jgi:hypothetical protein
VGAPAASQPPQLPPLTLPHIPASPTGSWGKYPNTAAWPGIPAVRLDTAVGSCLALDMLLTTFAMGFFCCLLATGGTQKEVRDRKCLTIHHQAYCQGYLLYTPVVVRDLFLRSLAFGLYLTALVGAPTFLLVWASIGSGLFSGYSYTVFKGLWCAAISAPLYALIFLPAIDRRCFPEMEFEELLERVEQQASKPSQFTAL